MRIMFCDSSGWMVRAWGIELGVSANTIIIVVHVYFNGLALGKRLNFFDALFFFIAAQS